MVTKKKIKVGLTGSIGSGKSAFGNILEEKGYPVIKVDELSKQILVSDKKIKDLIIKEFGNQAYNGNEVNKKYLADKIFSEPSNVAKINSIVHPVVIKEVADKIEELLKTNDIVFAEAALIYEADMEELFDYVVLVTADDKTRMRRKIERDGYTEEQFIKRDENQISDEGKKKRADFIFENNGSLKELKNKTDLLISILKGI